MWRRLWRRLTQGGCRSTRIVSLARDLGYELKVILWSDSTAARGVAARKGLSSRTRHMEVKFLWLQGALAKGQLAWKKVHTYANHADVLVKPTAREEMRRRLALVGGELHATQSDRLLQLGPRRGVGECHSDFGIFSNRLILAS